MGEIKLSIVIAVKDEVQNIPPLFKEISTVYLNLKDSGFSTELIIVDDDSNDGTREIVTQKMKELISMGMGVKPIFRTGHSGTVSAQIAGAIASDGDYVVIMDGDLQHNPELIIPMSMLISDRVDLVVASRHVPGASNNLSFFRALISNIACLLAQAIIKNSRICTDPLSGFFICRRDLVLSLKPYERQNKLLLYILAKYKNLTIYEIPYLMKARMFGKSKITHSLRKTIFRYISELLIYRKIEQDEINMDLDAYNPKEMRY